MTNPSLTHDDAAAGCQHFARSVGRTTKHHSLSQQYVLRMLISDKLKTVQGLQV
jgi:hypothetical protein